jgi:hypothetical protein
VPLRLCRRNSLLLVVFGFRLDGFFLYFFAAAFLLPGGRVFGSLLRGFKSLDFPRIADQLNDREFGTIAVAMAQPSFKIRV